LYAVVPCVCDKDGAIWADSQAPGFVKISPRCHDHGVIIACAILTPGMEQVPFLVDVQDTVILRITDIKLKEKTKSEIQG